MLGKIHHMTSWSEAVQENLLKRFSKQEVTPIKTSSNSNSVTFTED